MTIKDIAKNCSVSVSTVSRVLNQHPDVSEEVRRRVLDEVERCAYIPNNSARDLVRSRSDAIGVIVRGTGNLFFSRVLKTIADEIERYGYTPVPHFIGSDADEVSRDMEREDERRHLLQVIDTLTPREKEIMTLRFGLFGSREYTQKQVADRLGISQSYISRLEKKIIARIKEELEKTM